jgi:recombination protein U
MANKGKAFEEEIIKSNEGYKSRGIALVQKISTPWQVIRKGKKIVSAFPVGKSTLDFRGTVKSGISISFDCKEVATETRGLPLKNIEEHQIEYIREALAIGEVSFILCYMKMFDKRYFTPGPIVVEYWDRWKANKGRAGFNYIPINVMIQIKSRNGIVLDYLEGLEGVI